MHNRRKFMEKAAAVLSVFAVTPLASRAAAPAVRLEGVLAHHVFFWLHEPNNAGVRSTFEAALKELRRVPTIKLAHIGVPAGTESRDVVDHSYTYCMLTFFDSQEGQDAYQVHPIHEDFVAKNSHLWKKVVVYDSVG